MFEAVKKFFSYRKLAELKNAAAEKEQQNQLYEALLSSTPDLVYILDPDYRFIFANDALLAFMGYNREELLGKSLQEISSNPATSEQYEQALEQVIQTKKTIQGEDRFRHYKRGKRYYHFIFMPILDDQGEVKAVAGATRDITERKQIEHKLRNNEEKYRALVEHFPRGAVGLFDKDIRYTAVGGELIKDFDVAPEERVGSRVFDLYPDELVEKIEPYFKATLDGEKNEFEAELNGHHFFACTLPIKDDGGEVMAGMLVVQDITEHWQAKQELKAINETLEERVKDRTESLLSYQSQLRRLASRLSKAEENERRRLAAELHDNLGQMLAVSKLKMDLLKKDELPNRTVSALEDIREGLNDAIVYTRNLMSDLKPPPTLDKEDVRATIEWLADKMDKHNLKVIVKDDGQHKRTSEEIQATLLQSVREVLFNVVKHADVSEAEVKMERLDNKVQIIVEDEGRGFDPDAETSSSVEEGGFGLFNIQERLDLLGGDLEIRSEPGKGTTVKLLAPLRQKENIDSPMEDVTSYDYPKAGGDEEEIEVMLVDDHQMIREGLKKIVSDEEDLKVIAEASDGKKAVESARMTSPDIIVMDVDMPRMNGIDATREIISTMPEVEVIGLSFHNHRDLIDSMRAAGASAFLSKEEAFETLCATIRSEAGN